MTTLKAAPQAFRRAIFKQQEQEGAGKISKKEAEGIVKAAVKEIGKSSAPVDTLLETTRYIEGQILDPEQSFLPSNAKGWLPNSGYQVLAESETETRQAAIERLAKLSGVRAVQDPIKLARAIAANGLKEIESSRTPKKTQAAYLEYLRQAISLRTLTSQHDELRTIKSKFESAASRLTR